MAFVDNLSSLVLSCKSLLTKIKNHNDEIMGSSDKILEEGAQAKNPINVDDFLVSQVDEMASLIELCMKDEGKKKRLESRFVPFVKEHRENLTSTLTQKRKGEDGKYVLDNEGKTSIEMVGEKWLFDEEKPIVLYPNPLAKDVNLPLTSIMKLSMKFLMEDREQKHYLMRLLYYFYYTMSTVKNTIEGDDDFEEASELMLINACKIKSKTKLDEELNDVMGMMGVDKDSAASLFEKVSSGGNINDIMGMFDKFGGGKMSPMLLKMKNMVEKMMNKGQGGDDSDDDSDDAEDQE